MFTIWVIVALLGFTVWIGIARETRLALNGYIFQMVCVLVLYFYIIYPTGEPATWAGWAAMAIIRLIAIPILIQRFLKGAWWNERNMKDLTNAQAAIIIYVFLAAVGFILGNYLLKSVIVGGALGMLLLGMGIVILKHDPTKQIFGLLSADTAADLLIIKVLSKMTFLAETAIYAAVFLAVLCMVILVKVIEVRTKERLVHTLTNLRG